MNYLRLALQTLMIIIVTLIGLRILFILIQRLPGLVVSMSVIALGVLGVAWYKGSFSAIGLNNRKSIMYTMIGMSILFFVSLSILLFVEQ